ncbi:MAG: TonB-dependent receptor [Cytophagaceae bacterium]|jgi:outer membrane receptor for ferrienterochelin and colicins|nr:TonB-dependent receptor [Cytophagaceae bacterium]
MKVNKILVYGIVLLLFATMAKSQALVLEGKLWGEDIFSFTNTKAFLLQHDTVRVKHDGSFTFSKLKVGNYQLCISGPTLDSMCINIPVTADTFLLLEVSKSASWMREVVVTATRTPRKVEDLSVPVTVITSEQIKQMGATRLSDVLREQTGLAVVSDHGASLQLQGLSSEYTLILLNGQPLIGRTAGTFDLNRIAVGNIRQIEITKGPASCLYGSEAMAGVINIITEEPKKNSQKGEALLRYGSNGSALANASISYAGKNIASSLFVDAFRTSGYYLGESTIKVVPPHQQYTAQATTSWKVNKKTSLHMFSRHAAQFQQAQWQMQTGGSGTIVNDHSKFYDASLSVSLDHSLTRRHKLSFRWYGMQYRASSVLSDPSSLQPIENSWFRQPLLRPEVQYQQKFAAGHEWVSGAGYTWEGVSSSRYVSSKRMGSVFLFSNMEWAFSRKVKFSSGMRADLHSVYGHQWNPKISIKWNLNDMQALKISTGRGFKAPDFRQLYLHFSNTTEGYSVLGSEVAAAQLDQWMNQGIVTQTFLPLSEFNRLQAERSYSLQISLESQWHKKAKTTLSFFRNELQHLISSTPVAIKSNGQLVYSYLNLSQVFTQGLEAEGSWQINERIKISAGYQWMEAKDREVLRDIRAGRYYTRDPKTFRIYRLEASQYGGLFNRSRHMLQLKGSYTFTKMKSDVHLRGMYRSRFGVADTNGNLILDQDEEYVQGYWIWNLTAGKKMGRHAMVQAGIENILNVTSAEFLPNLPGRIYFLSLSSQLWSKSKNYEK